MTGTVLRVARFAVHDGPGIRTTVFLKGCPLRCTWCHSPESQSPDPEFLPLPGRCIGCGTCVAACPRQALSADARTGGPAETRPNRCTLCGTCAAACPTGARVLAGATMSVAEVTAAIERDRVFYDQSRGGVTVSGGEPLMQAPFVEALVDRCRARGIHVAVDTSGFGAADALDRLHPDLFLFDLKVIDEDRHRAATAVSNRPILQNLARLAERRRQAGGSPAVVVRLPLVPGVTDARDNLDAIGRLMASLGLARIDVLPYHRGGLAKYERLRRPYPLPDTDPPTPEQVQRAVDVLSAHGLLVHVGGA